VKNRMLQWKRPNEKWKEPNTVTERNGHKERIKRDAEIKLNAERKETRYKDRKKECRDLNQMLRGKKPDAEIEKGMRRFEPNAEKKENRHRDRKRNADI